MEGWGRKGRGSGRRRNSQRRELEVRGSAWRPFQLGNRAWTRTSWGMAGCILWVDADNTQTTDSRTRVRVRRHTLQLPLAARAPGLSHWTGEPSVK